MLRGIFALAALTLAAGACGGGEETPGPATTRPAPTGTPAPGSRVITDFLGRTVAVPASPARIVAMSPSAVELVYAAGGAAIGRPSSATHPPEALSVPEFGSSYRPNLEQIMVSQPDLILADSVLQPGMRDQLEALGVPVVFVGAQNFADVARALRLTGEAIGRPEDGEAAASALESRLAALKVKLPPAGPRLLILNGTPQDFFVAKSESYVGDLAKQLGAVNVADGQPDVGRFGGYTKMTLEAVVATDPEIILVITAAGPDAPRISDELKRDPAWQGLRAVKEGNVHEIDLQVFLQAPGPRAAEGLDTLMSLLYPDLAP